MVQAALLAIVCGSCAELVLSLSELGDYMEHIAESSHIWNTRLPYTGGLARLYNVVGVQIFPVNPPGLYGGIMIMDDALVPLGVQSLHQNSVPTKGTLKYTKVSLLFGCPSIVVPNYNILRLLMILVVILEAEGGVWFGYPSLSSAVNIYCKLTHRVVRPSEPKPWSTRPRPTT